MRAEIGSWERSIQACSGSGAAGPLDVSEAGDYTLEHSSAWHRVQRVTMSSQIFDPGNGLLRECLDGRDALVVCSPSVESLYGHQLREYFSAMGGCSRVEVRILERTEASKTIDAVVRVCEEASTCHLSRTSPVVAVGGGVCTDICGLAAALYRRGVPHIKIPTTLVGLVDAGIGTKNAINHRDRKNILGSFHTPEHSILDAGFLRTLPRRHLLNGLAEVIKIAMIADRPLFRLLQEHAGAVSRPAFWDGGPVSMAIIRGAVASMMTQLAQDPYELFSYKRKADFGHTFSPYIETASRHDVMHGEAVAMDLALSAEVACELGVLSDADRDQLLKLLGDVGLAMTWPGTSVDELWKTLPAVAQHRDGDLNLAVPTGIGSCEFLSMDALSSELLRRSHAALAQRAAGGAGDVRSSEALTTRDA